MHILLLGSGGREHALARQLALSPQCSHLYIAPGNAGTAQEGENVALSPTDFPALKTFVRKHSIDMVVVGPEAPLAAGVVDYFNRAEGLSELPVIGPTQAAAQLESSKAFAKAFMQKHHIPTARYGTFTGASQPAAKAFLQSIGTPVVLKADGLAAGKGVLICHTPAEAEAALETILGGKFGEAGHRVVIEEFLAGKELSVFAITDGQHYHLLPTAKDYKRIGEGDTGLNTGGMGAISPVPFADESLMETIVQKVVEPTINGMADDGHPYKGILYFGLMIVDNEPYVIEYNARFGDPEAEVLVPRIKTDLVSVFTHLHSGTLDQITLDFDTRAAATVMLVSKGYPEAYEKGKVIENIPPQGKSLLFHAGTRLEGDKVLTNGGRVLAITSFGEHLSSALEQSYQIAGQIAFEGKYYRSDIGFDL